MAPTLAEPFSNSSFLIDFVIKQGNRVRGLSEMGLKSLPKQHIQPLDQRMCMTNILAQESIPIINMSNWEDPQVAKSICDAASKWGFFQIINHEVPVEVLENIKDATYRFFGLPAEVKNQYSEDHSHLAQVLALKQRREQELDYMNKDHLPLNNVKFGTSLSPEKALSWKEYLSLFYVS
ncbi:hypothetical protein DITRI_Ditri15bG0037700 [Diplodiscus trichospermus]